MGQVNRGAIRNLVKYRWSNFKIEMELKINLKKKERNRRAGTGQEVSKIIGMAAGCLPWRPLRYESRQALASSS